MRVCTLIRLRIMGLKSFGFAKMESFLRSHLKIRGMVIEKEETKEKTSKPSWVKMKSEELEKIVVDLAKKGESPAKIGLILRDTHGVPKAKLLGKKITHILKEHGIAYASEQDRVEKRIA